MLDRQTLDKAKRTADEYNSRLFRLMVIRWLLVLLSGVVFGYVLRSIAIVRCSVS